SNSPPAFPKNFALSSSIRRLPAACSQRSRLSPPPPLSPPWSADEFRPASLAESSRNAIRSSRFLEPSPNRVQSPFVQSCMAPATHGITGALLGKGFFSERGGARVAIFSATLGAVFPDIDTVADAISDDPLAIIKYHRGITHSFTGL